jgi:hypothetical protein
LAVGDPLVVRDSERQYRHRKVAKVGRIWLTDDYADRFQRLNGKGRRSDQYGSGFYAMTVPEWEAEVETEQLANRLVAAGWVPRHKLTLPQLRRAAALLGEFEAERTGGLL